MHVFKNDVETFANHYASSMPGKMRKFQQSDVEQALEVFQASFQPPAPAPAPSPPPPPHQRNPNNLFGQLMRSAYPWGLSKDVIVRWLKWYTGQPHICPIAENPSHDDFTKACDAMVRDISPGAGMFRGVCEHGISSETVGPETFHELMRMRNGPKPGHNIWAFESCPNPIDLQRAITFKRVGDWGHVSGYIKGFYFQPNGEVVHFNYLGYKVNSISMVGCPAIVWASHVGQAVYTKRAKDFAGVSLDIYVECAETNMYGQSCAYTSGRDDYANLDMLVGLSVGNRMREDREAFFGRRYVTPTSKENLSREHECAIRTNPGYQAACNEAMAEIGGNPVEAMASILGHEEADDSDPCGEEAELSWGAAAAAP